MICEVLGVPEEERGDFRAWSDVMVAPMQHGREAVAAALQQGIGDMLRLIAFKREHPGDDLLSALIQARDDEDRLTEEELVELATQLLLGVSIFAVDRAQVHRDLLRLPPRGRGFLCAVDRLGTRRRST